MESSGWAVLTYCKQTGHIYITQVMDHDLFVIPDHRLLLVMDVWEHAYYLDYKNEKSRYSAAFWDVVDWETVDRRLEKILGE